MVHVIGMIVILAVIAAVASVVYLRRRNRGGVS
jgi:hypothetical protein